MYQKLIRDILSVRYDKACSINTSTKFVTDHLMSQFEETPVAGVKRATVHNIDQQTKI